jgi:hypothetical protein
VTYQFHAASHGYPLALAATIVIGKDATGLRFGTDRSAYPAIKTA